MTTGNMANQKLVHGLALGSLVAGSLSLSTGQAGVFTDPATGFNPGYYAEEFVTLFDSYTPRLKHFDWVDEGNPINFSQPVTGSFPYTMSAPQGLTALESATDPAAPVPEPFNESLSSSNLSGPTDTVTLTFTGGDVSAVGGKFFLTTAAGQLVSGSMQVTVKFNTGPDYTGTLISPEHIADLQFWGYAAEGSGVFITELSLTPGEFDTDNYVTFENVYAGGAVPEPGAWTGVAALGLAGWAAYRRRQKSV